jgi:catechol-2,3-dioxygenase
MKLKHLHLNVRDRPASEAFYATWLGMSVARREERMTFLTDEDGFELDLMDDDQPGPMPSWFHFGYRLPSAEAVVELHRRMSEFGLAIRRPLAQDHSAALFRCADPDGYAIEIYWEAPHAPLE